MGEWAHNSRFRVGFPLISRHYTSLSRAFTMADEKSIIALWLFLCRECDQGSFEDCESHGFAGEHFGWPCLSPAHSGSSFGALYKSAVATDTWPSPLVVSQPLFLLPASLSLADLTLTHCSSSWVCVLVSMYQRCDPWISNLRTQPSL